MGRVALVVEVVDPFGGIGFPALGLFEVERPAVEPRDAVLAKVAIGKQVSAVLHGLGERNDFVAAFGHHGEHGGHGVGVELVGVEQDDLGRFPAEDLAGAVFEEREDAVEVIDVLGADLSGLGGGDAEEVGVDAGDNVIGRVDGDGGHLVAFAGQKISEFLFGLGRGAGVEKRVPEVAALAAIAGLAEGGFSGEDVAGVFGNGCAVVGGMGGGVIAEFGALGAPEGEDGLEVGGRDFCGAAGVHKAGDGGIAAAGKEIFGHLQDGGEVAALARIAAAGEIVERDGDGALLGEGRCSHEQIEEE